MYILRLPSHLLLSNRIRERRSKGHSNAVHRLITILLFIVLLPVCIVIFGSQWLLLAIVDALRLIWQESLALSKEMLNLWHRHVSQKALLAILQSEGLPELGHKPNSSFKGGSIPNFIRRKHGSQAAGSTGRFHYILQVLSQLASITASTDQSIRSGTTSWCFIRRSPCELRSKNGAGHCTGNINARHGDR